MNFFIDTSMRNKQLLLIFTKNTIPGTVKTRLAKDIGDTKALEVYEYLLAYTQQITQNLPATDKVVYYSHYIEANDLWSNDYYQKLVQQGEDLGGRMNNAFVEGFDQGYTSTVIIGSDCIEITQEIIQEAFEALKVNDFVIGPARDGGYYLLGMNQLYSSVFQNKTWSTDTVFQDTMRDLESISSKIYQLPQLSDVDTVQDLSLLQIDL